MVGGGTIGGGWRGHYRRWLERALKEVVGGGTVGGGWRGNYRRWLEGEL